MTREGKNMSDLRQRDLLYSRLQEALGDEPAGILMTYLPPTTELATSEDIRGVIAHIDDLKGTIDGRMDQLDGRMDQLGGHMGQLDGRMDRFEERMDRFEVRMDRFGETLIRFDGRLHGFHDALRDQTRNFMFFSVGTMVTLVAASVTAASIL
jgi:hypothetical protein